MTFREKLQMEHPEKVNEMFSGGCQYCPYHYGYEKEMKCKVWESDEKCAKCWDREMPGTEPKEEKTLKLHKEDFIQIGYNQGLNDAWELARKIFTFNCNEMNNIFGFREKRYVFDELDAQEALARLKAYEEQKVLTRGDEVICLDTDEKAIFFGKSEGSEEGWFLMKDYDVPQRIMLNTVKKTGKHIDCLEQIGE